MRRKGEALTHRHDLRGVGVGFELWGSGRCQVDLAMFFVLYDHINYFMLGIEIITIDQHTSVTLDISIN